jgi:hypothetical protein
VSPAWRVPAPGQGALAEPVETKGLESLPSPSSPLLRGILVSLSPVVCSQSGRCASRRSLPTLVPSGLPCGPPSAARRRSRGPDLGLPAQSRVTRSSHPRDPVCGRRWRAVPEVGGRPNPLEFARKHPKYPYKRSGIGSPGRLVRSRSHAAPPPVSGGRRPASGRCGGGLVRAGRRDRPSAAPGRRRARAPVRGPAGPSEAPGVPARHSAHRAAFGRPRGCFPRPPGVLAALRGG